MSFIATENENGPSTWVTEPGGSRVQSKTGLYNATRRERGGGKEGREEGEKEREREKKRKGRREEEQTSGTFHTWFW